jgi:hypothetical protein
MFLLVLHVMIFDFLTYGTGCLEPSYEAIRKRFASAVRRSPRLWHGSRGLASSTGFGDAGKTRTSAGASFSVRKPTPTRSCRLHNGTAIRTSQPRNCHTQAHGELAHPCPLSLSRRPWPCETATARNRLSAVWMLVHAIPWPQPWQASSAKLASETYVFTGVYRPDRNQIKLLN